MRHPARVAIPGNLRAILVAVLALLLLVGTALAVGAPAPLGSAALRQQASGTETPDGSESPEASEPPEGSEPPEASEAPESAGPEDAGPSPAQVDRVVSRLADAGISTTASEVQALAAKVGVGGAVRVLAFAHASGKTPTQILAMFEGGMGWGQIDRQLHLSIGPGIGWIMGHGHKAKSK